MVEIANQNLINPEENPLKVLISLPYDDTALLRQLGSSLGRVIAELEKKQASFRSERVGGVQFKWSPKKNKQRNSSQPRYIPHPIPNVNFGLRLTTILGREDHILLFFENDQQSGGAIVTDFWTTITSERLPFDFGLVLETDVLYFKNSGQFCTKGNECIELEISCDGFSEGTSTQVKDSQLEHVLTR